MIKKDIIQTYIFEPNYYESEKPDIYREFLRIFNNNNLYIYIIIYNNTFYKIKQIKQNYIIFSCLNYFYKIKNIKRFSKLKNYDNTEIDIKNGYDASIYNFDLKITNLYITKKIDKDIYIIKDIYIKYINNTATRKHKLFNSKHYYSKNYITYYKNYYIIIYNDTKRNFNINVQNRNTIFCNFSRNFMLFI